MEGKIRILQAFGSNLKRIREEKELKQLDVEIRSGINVGEISRYENGKQSMELITILRLAEALEVSPADLVIFDYK